MDVEEQFSNLASLIGEPARSKMLWSLLDGRAFTATELAIMAEVSPQSASMHLHKLVEAQLLVVERQGRHRYYKFSSREVAYAIEAIANLIPAEKAVSKENILANGHIKYCRSCYDHLAGKVGVSVTDSLLNRSLIIPADTQYSVTTAGLKWFTRLGIDIDELKTRRRAFAKQCLDWSERRHHIAGSLGAVLLEKMLAEDWIRKTKNSRAMVVTAQGEKKLYELLGLTIN